jgi:hypothetical protein
MAKSVIIKLTTAGTSVGPFNMLSDADSYATPFETNISRATLVTGYTSSLVPNAATIIRALSSGSCTQSVDLPINVPTTTTTTTTTTTAAPTTSTTTTTTTAAPTTTSTTTTTTTEAPTTTSTTTTTTTAAPTTTSTTTTTTTAAPTTTSTTTTTTTAAPTTTSTTTTTTTATPTCTEYRIENNTESSIGVSWYDCSGIQQFENNLGSGQQITFCANTIYGPIEYSSGTLFTIGACTITTTTTSTTTTTTTAAPTTTSTTTTTTTEAPTTSTTTTTTTVLTQNLFFDASTGIGGYTITAIDVNGVTPTLTSGADVPFSTDGHGYSTAQTGTNQTLNITIGSVSANGCIQVTDSGANYYQLPVSGAGTISFTGLVINNTTEVNITLADGTCP